MKFAAERRVVLGLDLPGEDQQVQPGQGLSA